MSRKLICSFKIPPEPVVKRRLIASIPAWWDCCDGQLRAPQNLGSDLPLAPHTGHLYDGHGTFRAVGESARLGGARAKPDLIAIDAKRLRPSFLDFEKAGLYLDESPQRLAQLIDIMCRYFDQGYDGWLRAYCDGNDAEASAHCDIRLSRFEGEGVETGLQDPRIRIVCEEDDAHPVKELLYVCKHELGLTEFVPMHTRPFAA